MNIKLHYLCPERNQYRYVGPDDYWIRGLNEREFFMVRIRCVCGTLHDLKLPEGDLSLCKS